MSVLRKLSLAVVLGLAGAGAGLAPTQPAPLTIASSARVVTYGEAVRVSGVLRDRPAGAAVTLYVRRHGDSAWLPVSADQTDPGGTWSFSYLPTLRSSFEARSNGLRSATVTVGVRPRLTLTRRRSALFTQAVAARSFRGHHVWLQRRSARGRWNSLKKIVLDNPPRRFRARLPRGVSRIRVSLSRRQAGPGYEPAVSRVLVVRRK
jgi:hypothetical protein